MEFRQQHQQQPCPSRHAEPSGLQQGESKRQPVAELQIVNIDYHMTSPTSVDCTPRPPYNVFEEPLKQVPVIRIFGTTRGQQRMCLHVHQVWPYLYVRYDGEASIEAVRGFGYQLGVGLNHALNVSLKSVGSLFVVAVVPVKGVPFYGFCAGYRPFLKIFLANPDMLLRASTLLAAGAVMSKKHEIFESHLSYVMQFMVDYNLYGVEWIRLDRLLFRSPLPMPVPFAGQHPLRIADDTVHAEHRWIPQGMPSYLVNPAPPDRVCHCELEADATAADIANRQQVRERAIHHVLSEGQLDVQFGRLVHSLDRIWIDENRQSIHEVMPTVAPLPGALSDGTCTSDAGNESTDSSEPLHAGYQVLSSVSIHDTEDIDTLDASWVENELLKAEMRHKSSSDAPEPRILCSSRPPRRPSAIPQDAGKQ
ncbi:DNA polymerase zeta [Coemansia sp. RSA 2320]|nr:DNA polymerase zeta [Coemansia sp. RSA 2320]